MRSAILGGVAALAFAGALVGLHVWSAHGVQDIAAPAHLDVPAAGVTLPMQSLGGRPVVEVTIEGKGPYRFILDTAASSNVIDTALQEELGLPSVLADAVTPTGAAVTLVKVSTLRVGGATLSGLTAAALPVARLFPAQPRPRGVLSALAFPGHLVTFDYPAARISIVRGELAAEDGARTFSYAGDPLPALPLRVAGHDVRVHLDTGAETGLTLPRRYLEELPLASKPVASGKTRTPTGETTILAAKVAGPITLGAHALDLGDVRFGDVSPGTLGYAGLRTFVVTLDSRRHRVRLER